MHLDLKHLRQIVAIAETGSFANAAKTLALSQPALSRSLQSLERRIGARLFDRDRNGVVPTPTGRILLNHAHTLLKQASEAERDVNLLLGRGAGHLRIGAGPYPAAISISSAVARFVTRHPGVSMEVHVGGWDVLTRQVLETELDLAVAEVTPSEQDDRLSIERLPVHPGAYFCRAGHPLTHRRRVTLQDVRKYPLAMTVIPERLHHLKPAGTIRGVHGGADKTLPWIHVNTFDLARRIILESDAVGLAVVDQIASEIDAGLLVMLDLPVPGAHTNYGIVKLAGRTLSPAADAFLEILRKVEAGITAARGRRRSAVNSGKSVARSA